MGNGKFIGTVYIVYRLSPCAQSIFAVIMMVEIQSPRIIELSMENWNLVKRCHAVKYSRILSSSVLCCAKQVKNFVATEKKAQKEKEKERSIRLRTISLWLNVRFKFLHRNGLNYFNVFCVIKSKFMVNYPRIQCRTMFNVEHVDERGWDDVDGEKFYSTTWFEI